MKQGSKKKNAVMLADTRPALVGTVLMQLKRTNPDLFSEAIIYYLDPISDKDRQLMSSILPCRFIKYVSPLPKELFRKERFKLFSELMFARYEMFSYLSEFEAITWLDTDILIQKDISDMLEKANQTGAALICEDPVNKTAERPDRMKTCFTAELPGYKTDAYLYCSGTIVITDKIDKIDDCTRWCYEKTVEWSDILSLPDQGVINAAIQAFHIQVTPLCGEDFCCYPYMGRDCSEAAIIHAWGLNKFWNDWYVHEHYSAWANYYQEWLKQGGCPLPFVIAPSISIVIPTYKPNTEYLRQCLDSLMVQKRSNWERFSDFEILIVAEPFDIAQIQEVVEMYHDKRINLEVNQERLGIAASLNRGIRMARGTYIARMDDDDIAAPDRLFAQAKYLDTHENITLCTSDFEYFGDMNEHRVSFEGELCRAWSIFTCPFDHPTVMFRRAFFAEKGLFYDEKRGYVEDWELWLRAFDCGMTVGCIHQVLLYHRWMNTGGAGQTSKTVEMMRKLVQVNFMRLNIFIPDEDIYLVGPWNGKLCQEGEVERLAGYFEQALIQNKKQCLYDQDALQHVFALRMEEAKTGKLPGLSKTVVRNEQETKDRVAVPIPRCTGETQQGLFHRFLKFVLKPLYRPFRRRYEDRIIGIQNSGWVIEGHVLNCISKLDQIHEHQQKFAAQSLDTYLSTTEQLLAAQAADIQQLTERIDSMENAIRFMMEAYIDSMEENTQANIVNIDAMQENLTGQMHKAEESLTGQLIQIKENIMEQMIGTKETLVDAGEKLIQQVVDTEKRIMGQQIHAEEGMGGQIKLVGDHLYDLKQDFRFEQSLFASERRGQKKVFLIGTPEHSNIGDAAITIGEMEFIRRFLNEFQLVELSTYDFSDWYNRLSSLVTFEDLILLQGGGNIGNRYLVEEHLRRRVISDFPKNKIVILPQTISFDDNDEGRKELALSASVYNRHENLTLFTRGPQSLALAKKYFPGVKSAEMLDMALMLDEEYKMERGGLLLCIRDLDDESGLTEEQYAFVEETVQAVGLPVTKTNNLNQNQRNANIHKDIRRSMVTAQLKKFAGCKAVVTDRLHGMIFSIITHTPCVVLSSYNHKLKDFCAFFSSSNSVFFVDKRLRDLEDAIHCALRVETPEYPILELDMFKELYDKILE